MKQWSGHPHPEQPGKFWRDDETGEAVCVTCSERAPTLQSINHTGAMGRPCPRLSHV